MNPTPAVALDFGSRSAQVDFKISARIPRNRVEHSAGIAGEVAFLAGDDACIVEGVNLPTDGGLMAPMDRARTPDSRSSWTPLPCPDRNTRCPI